MARQGRDGDRRGLDDGSIRPDVDPVPTADILVSLVDGLCTRWLSGGLSLDRARSLMRDAIYLQLDPGAGSPPALSPAQAR